jgi:hypothetical protein
MGYTAYRAWTAGAGSINPETVALAKQGATLYTLQLALNLIWTPLYFGMGRPIAATVDILALGGTVGYLAYIWGQVDPVCGWLLAPYLGWLSFATYLCVSVTCTLTCGACTNSCTGWKRLPERLGLQECLQEGLSDTQVELGDSVKPTCPTSSVKERMNTLTQAPGGSEGQEMNPLKIQP